MTFLQDHPYNFIRLPITLKNTYRKSAFEGNGKLMYCPHSSTTKEDRVG